MYLFKKIFFTLLLTHYAFATDSYMRGLLSFAHIESIDEDTMLYSMVRGEQISSISPNLYVEADVAYSTDFSFNVVEAGIYANYILPIFNSKFSLSSRIGGNYEKLKLNDITFKEEYEDLSGVFFSYGLGVEYRLFKDTDFYINVTQKGNSTHLGYGLQSFF